MRSPKRCSPSRAAWPSGKVTGLGQAIYLSPQTGFPFYGLASTTVVHIVRAMACPTKEALFPARKGEESHRRSLESSSHLLTAIALILEALSPADLPLPPQVRVRPRPTVCQQPYRYGRTRPARGSALSSLRLRPSFRRSLHG